MTPEIQERRGEEAPDMVWVLWRGLHDPNDGTMAVFSTQVFPDAAPYVPASRATALEEAFEGLVKTLKEHCGGNYGYAATYKQAAEWAAAALGKARGKE